MTSRTDALYTAAQAALEGDELLTDERLAAALAAELKDRDVLSRLNLDLDQIIAAGIDDAIDESDDDDFGAVIEHLHDKIADRLQAQTKAIILELMKAALADANARLQNAAD